MTLEFASSSASGKVWLGARQWMKEGFASQRPLAKQPLAEGPPRTLPKRLRNFLLSFDQDGKPLGLHSDRYEFWVYRQLRKRLDVGTFTSTTVCSIGVLPMIWCPWRQRPKPSQGTGYPLAASVGRPNA